MKNYSYEKDLDTLYIYNNSEKENVVGNIVFGNFILDIGENGKVLGIEIDCASKFFKTTPESLNDIKTASVEVIKFGNIVTLGLVLSTKIKEYYFQFALPKQNQQITAFC